MRSTMQGWMVVALLLGTMVYAVAEDFTLTTFYPSPRGVYQAVRIGSGDFPAGSNAFVQITKPAGSGGLPLRIDTDAAGWTNPVVVDAAGHVGIATASPAYELDVNGAARVQELYVPGGSNGQFLTYQDGRATWVTYTPPPPPPPPAYDDATTLKGYIHINNACDPPNNIFPQCNAAAPGLCTQTTLCDPITIRYFYAPNCDIDYTVVETGSSGGTDRYSCIKS